MNPETNNIHALNILLVHSSIAYSYVLHLILRSKRSGYSKQFKILGMLAYSNRIKVLGMLAYSNQVRAWGLLSYSNWVRA